MSYLSTKRDIVVSVLTSWRTGVQILVGERDFCIFQDVQTGCGAHPTSHSKGTGVFLFPAVNRPGHEVNLLPASSAEVKEWKSTSAPHRTPPPVCIHGMNRGNFMLPKVIYIYYFQFNTHLLHFPELKVGAHLNRLTPNDLYISRTAPLTSKRCILFIYSTNVGTEYFKHALYSPIFSLQNAVCFIMLTCLVPALFTFYIQGVLKLKKK